MSDVTYFFGGWAPILRILVVGTLAYATLVSLQRISGKRTLSQMNAFDFLITVALGASFGRILTARNVALAEAVTAFGLLVGLQFVIAVLRQRSGRIEHLVTASPTLLFYQHSFQRAEMRRQRITESELASAIRQSGFGSFEGVEAIILEADGKLAVVGSAQAGDAGALPADAH